MKKYIIFILGLCLLISSTGFAATDTTSAIVRAMKVYVSLNGDCSDPQEVWASADQTNGTAIDMNIGTVTDGTMTVPGTTGSESYKCIIFKMSDHITFVPAANEGSACVAGEPYTIDVCQDYGQGFIPEIHNPEAAGYPNDTPTACTDDADVIYTHVSTWSSATTGSENHEAFSPPTSDGDATHGFSLSTGAFTVTSSGGTLTFIFGTVGKVGTIEMQSGPECNMEAPGFGARIE